MIHNTYFLFLINSTVGAQGLPKYRTKNVGSREKEKNWVEKD
jgi:hypothetical protein